MRTRNLIDVDSTRIVEMHDKMQPGYTLPQMSPLFFIKKAVIDGNGKVIAVAAVKLVGEGFLWVDPESGEFERAKAVTMLNTECSESAKKMGLEEVSSWIPPQLEDSFGKALTKLGWIKSKWSTWSKAL